MLLLALCLLLSACALPGNEAETTPGITTVTLHLTTTPPETSPPETVPATTPPATTPPETALPVSVPLPVTEGALRAGFALLRPDYTLKEIVETDAGFFLFSMLTKPNYGPQHDCERNIDFLDKNTGIFAQNEFFWRAGETAASYFKGNITGYFLENDTNMIFYTHVGGEPYGHRHFPSPYHLSYEDGVLRFTSTPADVRSFYPVETDEFYTGIEYAPGVVVLSARFATQNGFALLFNAAEKGIPADYLPTPRVTYSFDGVKRQVHLFCPQIAMDGGLAGAVFVPSGHLYIKAAAIEAVNDGVRVVLTLKDAAELYTPWSSHLEQVGGLDQTHAALFELTFTTNAAQPYPDTHIFSELTYICQEK